MMDSEPAIAPASPPDTGASSICTDCRARRAAQARAVDGEIVLWSITREPGASPSAAPPAPNSTCSTSASAVTMVISASQCAASAVGESNAAAPSPTSGAMLAGRRACTATGNPARSRFRAIGRPITPRPITPTRILGRASALPSFPRVRSTVYFFP
jgi:hypothetical protein